MIKRLSWLVLICGLFIGISGIRAADPEIHAYSVGKVAYLEIAGQNVIRLSSGWSGLSSVERMELVEHRLKQTFYKGRIQRDSFKILTRQGVTGLICNGDWLITVDPVSAKHQQCSEQELAKEWRDNLTNAFAKINLDFKVVSSFSGIASWYGREFRGRRTANGERFDETKYTAAHRTLPFGTRVRVTNLNNGMVIIVTINDRGPWVGKRVLDLSWAAARAIGIHGIGPVKVEVLAEK